ncbi:hypothetical protein [Paracoccus cavernae]|uniref:hypothetical protein n=1 Tax=Paracoccus cavernae TaxID=1571207 RepID=UPI0035F44EAD
MTPTPTAAARVSGTIKALEWTDRPDASWANGFEYLIELSHNGSWYFDHLGPFETREAAKAAAQADYEARILAAIQPDPEPKPVAWLFEGSAFETEAEAKHACNCALLTFDRILPVYATPSSAGMVSVEAAAKPAAEIITPVERTFLINIAMEGTDADFRRYRYRFARALRALAGEGGR